MDTRGITGLWPRCLVVGRAEQPWLGRRSEQVDAIEGGTQGGRGTVQAQPLTVKSMLFCPGGVCCRIERGFPSLLARSHSCVQTPPHVSPWQKKRRWWVDGCEGVREVRVVAMGAKGRHVPISYPFWLAHEACAPGMQQPQCDGSTKSGPGAAMVTVRLQARSKMKE